MYWSSTGIDWLRRYIYSMCHYRSSKFLIFLKDYFYPLTRHSSLPTPHSTYLSDDCSFVMDRIRCVAIFSVEIQVGVVDLLGNAGDSVSVGSVIASFLQHPEILLETSKRNATDASKSKDAIGWVQGRTTLAWWFS